MYILSLSVSTDKLNVSKEVLLIDALTFSSMKGCARSVSFSIHLRWKIEFINPANERKFLCSGKTSGLTRRLSRLLIFSRLSVRLLLNVILEINC